jgi:hypothetical protein
MFRELPSWGFYVRHAKDITFKNVAVATKKCDFRPAFVFDDVSGVNMDNLYINGDYKRSQIILKNVTGMNLNVKPGLVKNIQ